MALQFDIIMMKFEPSKLTPGQRGDGKGTQEKFHPSSPLENFGNDPHGFQIGGTSLNKLRRWLFK